MRDMMGLMKQAQDMQKKMAEMQAQLDTLEFEGSAGGGLVKVVMTAKNVLKSVKIDPSLMVQGEEEILEDLVISASNDARNKAERSVQERMAEVTRGLPIPPGMKLF
ncbi:MAG: YbaB/EbfC family nucleoid-associated protein [Bosea sp.]|jgi:DNA-binding YbaB/EbfC family protein|uniref:Nucleoid-associated protein ACFPPC_26840 n=1 Tax=Bosea vestrisii TaxID=151416 RepID=A0ABW0HG86_9HYPH|nr:YbaB/EbfC family nucleoid-associated protein [Bosea sp. (in: a-proteobacteria)]MBA4223530.1 YbaB/EbfC family nucleoid-associated protein [Methylobacterium sp.]MBR3190202.1 YbaB/EbfC family nucleoid-associated protein [Bosea sp. (in: a-proteobacteria)]MCP4563466.1 YbaB/EbfC family nucleoid-associated protein [Bosea sp. (in: a-proteobacteria)]MCP4734712.1 YbaB/EbfC family nucleoid-associated protein [Bosea sp. (in: a-proteobacteria)]